MNVARVPISSDQHWPERPHALAFLHVDWQSQHSLEQKGGGLRLGSRSGARARDEESSGPLLAAAALQRGHEQVSNGRPLASRAAPVA
jgi:hypothetical protein